MPFTARILIIFSIVLLLAGCSAGEEPKQAVSTMAKMGQLATDPIAQMSLEFDGNPPQDQIREKVDKALAHYGLEANNENRGKAGRTLVALRKEHGHSEMAILDKMLATPAEGGDFDAAATRISVAMNQ